MKLIRFIFVTVIIIIFQSQYVFSQTCYNVNTRFMRRNDTWGETQRLLRGCKERHCMENAPIVQGVICSTGQQCQCICCTR